jgi:hypothetical protein
VALSNQRQIYLNYLKTLRSANRRTPTFIKLRLPSNAQTCSAMLDFYAPPGFDLNKIVAAGRSGGLLGANAAVGQCGTFDFQRVRDNAENTAFYYGYTGVSNIAVGTYLYGPGISEGGASLIANTFALFRSSNAGDPEQAIYRNLGYDLAAAGLESLMSLGGTSTSLCVN